MDFKKEFTETAEIEAEKEDVDANRVFGIFSYIFFPVPLFAAKNSKFASFHTRRGIIIVVAAIALSITASIINLIPVAKWILGLPLYILSLIPVAYCVLGIINAAKGTMKELPFFNKLTFLSKFLGTTDPIIK